MERELEERLIGQGLGASAGALAVYGAMLLDANARTNLTGAKSAEELLAQFEDALTLRQYVRDPLVDIGSGGGLPAVPLAIVTGISVTLLEASAKKARFLERVLSELRLKGRVVAMRAEDAAREEELREAFACGTCRAVGAATTAAELVLPFISVGGLALLQRGKMTAQETTSLSDAALVLGGELTTVLSIGERRALAIVRKEAPTPARFPRRSGVPSKRPLCEDVSRETWQG